MSSRRFKIFALKRRVTKSFVLTGCIVMIVLIYLIRTIREANYRSLIIETMKNLSISQCPNIEQHSVVSYSYTVHSDEKEFPLAFSLLVYTDADRAIRLLRAIYRPQNHYCIHIDRKSASEFVRTIEQATKHLNRSHNIYLVPESDRVDVQWGYISVLDPELICTRILLQPERRWKYWINLTGQEFPLRTNWELVTALKALNGANIVEAKYQNRIMNRIPPANYVSFNITWFKSSVHLAVRREFVEYMLTNPRAKELYEALHSHEVLSARRTHPEETFFTTLNHNPEEFPIPGAFTGAHEEHTVPDLARAKIWSDSGLPCGSGHWVRDICMFGMNDLPFLVRQPHFFANKFIPRVEPRAYDILECWFAAKVRNETLFNRLADSFDMSYYMSQPYAKQHL